MMKALFSADYSVDQSQTQWVKSVLEYHFSLAFELRVLMSGAAELGAQGAQLLTHFLTNWQLKQAFAEKRFLKIHQKFTELEAKCK